MAMRSGFLDILRHPERTEKHSSADNFDLRSIWGKSMTKTDESVAISRENIEEE